MTYLPKRINLAIAKKCYISCPGCYQLFGKSDPDLHLFNRSMSHFSEMGIEKVIISGGDPLTIKGILPFLDQLRKIDIKEIKLDTVGLGFFRHTAKTLQLELDTSRLTEFINKVDFLGIPLDNWSEESINHFRPGRTTLFNEINFLLEAVSDLTSKKMVVINTVVTNKNADILLLIYQIILKYKSTHSWNLFQYTSTDLVPAEVNDQYFIGNEDFFQRRASVMNYSKLSVPDFKINFYSIEDRLGYYLLINSDGEAWLPDETGRTIYLGNVFGREEEVLKLWHHHAERLSKYNVI